MQSGSADWFYVNASGPLDSAGLTAGTIDGDKAKQWYSAVSYFPQDHSPATKAKVFAICE